MNVHTTQNEYERMMNEGEETIYNRDYDK